MCHFNPCPMVIGVLELICLLPLARGKERLHLLFWMQGQAAPSRSRTGGPSGTDLTIALGKLHFKGCTKSQAARFSLYLMNCFSFCLAKRVSMSRSIVR